MHAAATLPDARCLLTSRDAHSAAQREEPAADHAKTAREHTGRLYGFATEHVQREKSVAVCDATATQRRRRGGACSSGDSARGASCRAVRGRSVRCCAGGLAAAADTERRRFGAASFASSAGAAAGDAAAAGARLRLRTDSEPPAAPSSAGAVRSKPPAKGTPASSAYAPANSARSGAYSNRAAFSARLPSPSAAKYAWQACSSDASERKRTRQVQQVQQRSARVP